MLTATPWGQVRLSLVLSRPAPARTYVRESGGTRRGPPPATGRGPRTRCHRRSPRRGSQQRQPLDTRHRAHHGAARSAARREPDLQPAAPRARWSERVRSRGPTRRAAAWSRGGASWHRRTHAGLHALLGRGLQEAQPCRVHERGRRDAPHVPSVSAELLGVTGEQVTLRVNCHLNNGLSLREIETWWLEALGLPAECRRTATVDHPSSASRWRRNVHVYGTASICVHSTFIAQSIYGAIQEYAGFERPEWLD